MNSAQTASARRMAQQCRTRLERLRTIVADNRNHVALYQLVDVAVGATKLVHSLWSEDPRITDAKERAERRRRMHEFLRHFVEPYTEVPIIYRRAEGPLAEQQEVIDALEWGAMRPLRRRTPLRQLVEDTVVHYFCLIRQCVITRPGGIDGEIWDLPPLSKETARMWAVVAVKWLWATRRTSLKRVGSALHAIAKPERELARDKRRLRASLAKRHRRWITRDGGKLDAVNATKLMVEQRRIDSLTVRPRHIREGLYDQIVGYWLRNLAE